MQSNVIRPYEAPSIRASGKVVEETRRLTVGLQEIEDVQPMYSVGSVGFAL